MTGPTLDFIDNSRNFSNVVSSHFKEAAENSIRELIIGSFPVQNTTMREMKFSLLRRYFQENS
jgi:hypothetical protein